MELDEHLMVLSWDAIIEKYFGVFKDSFSSTLIMEAWKARRSAIIDNLSSRGVFHLILQNIGNSAFQIPKSATILSPKNKKKIYAFAGANPEFIIFSTLHSLFIAFYTDYSVSKGILSWCEALTLPYVMKRLGRTMPIYISEDMLLDALQSDIKAEQVVSNQIYAIVKLFRILAIIHEVLIPSFRDTLNKYPLITLEADYSNFYKYHDSVVAANTLNIEFLSYIKKSQEDIQRFLALFEGREYKQIKKDIASAVFSEERTFFANHEEYYLKGVIALRSLSDKISPSMNSTILEKFLSRLEPPIPENDQNELKNEMLRFEQGEIPENKSLFCSLLLPFFQGVKQISYQDFEAYGHVNLSFPFIKNLCSGTYHLTEAIPIESPKPAEESVQEVVLEKRQEKKKKKKQEKKAATPVKKQRVLDFPYLPEYPKRDTPVQDMKKVFFDLLDKELLYQAWILTKNVDGIFPEWLAEALSLSLYLYSNHTKTLQRLKEIASAHADDILPEYRLYAVAAFLRPALYDPCPVFATLWTNLYSLTLSSSHAEQAEWVDAIRRHAFQETILSLHTGDELPLSAQTASLLQEMNKKTMKYAPASKVLLSLYKKTGILGKPLSEALDGVMDNLEIAAKFADSNYCQKYLKKMDSLHVNQIEGKTRLDLIEHIQRGGILALNWQNSEKERGMARGKKNFVDIVERFAKTVNLDAKPLPYDVSFCRTAFGIDRYSAEEPVYLKNCSGLTVKGLDPDSYTVYNFRDFTSEYTSNEALFEHIRRGHTQCIRRMMKERTQYENVNATFKGKSIHISKIIEIAEKAWENLYNLRKMKILPKLYHLYCLYPSKRAEIREKAFAIQTNPALHDAEWKAIKRYVADFSAPEEEDALPHIEKLEFWRTLCETSFPVKEDTSGKLVEMLKRFLKYVDVHCTDLRFVAKKAIGITTCITFTGTDPEFFATKEPFTLLLFWGTNYRFIEKQVEKAPGNLFCVQLFEGMPEEDSQILDLSIFIKKNTFALYCTQENWYQYHVKEENI